MFSDPNLCLYLLELTLPLATLIRLDEAQLSFGRYLAVSLKAIELGWAKTASGHFEPNGGGKRIGP
jgi:hypothetical protein